MTIVDFQKSLFLTPKNQNFYFQKIHTYTITIFEEIQETGIYRIEVYTNNQCAKFQANVFISGCAMAQNQVNVMTSVFEPQFLSFLIVARQNE